MDVLDCVGIELIIEGMRPKLFEILSNNVLELSAFCDKKVASGNFEIEILDEFNDSRIQDDISIAKVLNVRVCSRNYRYYILKMRGFYCLPAFLVPNLPCTPGYLRLEVENQNNIIIFSQINQNYQPYLKALFVTLMSPFYSRKWHLP